MTYRQALERLFQRRRFGVRPGLDGIRDLLSQLHNPERQFRAIHIAGTNGKGSTAAFTESILRTAKVRTGLYTSPHLVRFTERIRIDGVELSETETAHLAEQVMALAPEATFFEVATATAFLAFALHGVEVAVVEAGLGGRLDSTNVLEAPLATVVTGVALDHTDVLGPTLVDIAREKAGIFKAGVPAVLACDDEEARATLLEVAATVGAPAWLYGRELAATSVGERGLAYGGPGGALGVDALGLPGAFQRRNAALALAATALAAERGGYRLDDEARRRGLAEARWPGRLESLADDLLVDAAHNPDGARTLAAELPSIARGRPVTLVVGMVADKDAPAMLEALVPLAARLIFTRAPSPRSREPGSLRALVDGRGEVVDEPARAIAEARDGRSLVVVAGSIFLVGEARRLVTGERADPLAAQDPPAQKL